MANMRAIKGRIHSISTTQQITRAMKMVSASKLRKVQSRMINMRRVAKYGQDMFSMLLESGEDFDNEVVKPRKEVKKVAYVLFVGNRGLCGSYNVSLLHYFQKIIEKEERDWDLLVYGRWGQNVFKKMNIPVAKEFQDAGETPDMTEATDLFNFLLDAYLKREYDEIHLVHQTYVSALKQEPDCRQLFPAQVKPAEGEKEIKGENCLLEPDANSIMNKLFGIYFLNEVLAVLLEAKACEHSARVTAMGSATDNTEKIISQLQLSYNRARQAAITKEVSEIVGGAAALKKKSN